MSVRVGHATAAELDIVRAIRQRVFVEEQAVPVELEADGRDGASEHFLGWVDSRPVATARARSTEKGWKVERVAVLEPDRRTGVGLSLIRYVLESAPPGVLVYVHAQEGALGFWQRAGFIAEGPSFEEAGISHRWMRYSAARAG